MKDLSLTQILEMQRALQAKYGEDWIQMAPENGHYSVLWAVSEIGEVIDVIKKDGYEAIMNDPEVRAHFLSEVSDVMMFMGDLLLCFDVSPEELATEYKKKHDYNMIRWD